MVWHRLVWLTDPLALLMSITSLPLFMKKSFATFISTMFVTSMMTGCSTPQIPSENGEPQSGSSAGTQWETYTNANYGLSFQYPPDWKLQETIDQRNTVAIVRVYVSNVTFRDDQYYWALDDGQALFMVNVQPKNDILPWGGRKDAEKNFTLGGTDAHRGLYELTDGGPGSGTPTAIEISAYKNDREYILNLIPPTGPFTETLDQILSTFTLTDEV